MHWGAARRALFASVPHSLLLRSPHAPCPLSLMWPQIQSGSETEHESDSEDESDVVSVVVASDDGVEEPPSVDEDEYDSTVSDFTQDIGEHDNTISDVVADQDSRPQRGTASKLPKHFDDFYMNQVMCDVEDVAAPTSVKQAFASEDAEEWRHAMRTEMESLHKNKTWTLVDKPKDRKIVKNKWVFKVKRDANGEIQRYKARLVAKGFSQVAGVDYSETFAPVIRHSSLRVLFALAVQNDLRMEHLDVETAFLQGDLEEDIFMYQPEGFVQKGTETKVCKLNKALYGLKQASRAWNLKVCEVLGNLGFERSQHDPCVFIRTTKKTFLVIVLYVDDFFLFHNSSSEAESVKRKLQEKFILKDLGALSYALGMQLERTRGTDGSSYLRVNQKQYIVNLLEKYGMTSAKTAATPLELNFKVSPDKPPINTVPYQELVGSLLYLSVCTRPDITYAVSYLSQFNVAHTQEHWQAAKRVLRYLKGTMDIGLTYSKCEAMNSRLIGFVDADWAGDASDRKSYSGFVFKIGDSVVSWESRKQKTIALSSTEAEYIAMSEGAKEALHLSALMGELGWPEHTVTIYGDNQSALKLSASEAFHRRTKHVDVRLHHIRDLVKSKTLDFKYMPSKDMPADFLTKSLSSPKVKNCCKILGVCD